MKRPGFLFAPLTCLALVSAWAAPGATPAPSHARIERVYLIEGMSCGGCAFSVERSLKRIGIGASRILQIDYGKVGQVRIAFDEKNYHGRATDCQVIEAIRAHSGYLVYNDPRDKNPCPSNLVVKPH